MSPDTFAWLVPLSLLTIAIVFFVLRVYRIGSWWWSGMFALGTGAFTSSIFPAESGSVLKPLTEDALFLGAFLCLSGGLRARAARRPFWPLLLLVAAGAFAGAAVAVLVHQSVVYELFAVQSGIVVLLLLNAFAMVRRLRHAPDRILFALILFSALLLVVQNAALFAFPDPSLDIASWSSSGWALALQASGATIGVLIAVAISLTIGRDIFDSLREAAGQDPLTLALNRRGFDERCDAAVSARRRNDAMSLILIDIDHFKGVNDRFGHWAGDSVLCAMADLLKTVCGASCAVGRLGGEEFAVLLPGRNLEIGREKAEAIRQAFAATRWPDPIGEHRVTASFGVTDFGDGETLVTAMERADRLLYFAKDHGRNQVCFCSSGSTILPPDPTGIGGSATLERARRRPMAAA